MTATGLLAVLSMPLHADEVRLLPESVTLDGPAAQHRVIAVLVNSAGHCAGVPTAIQFRSADKSVVR